MTVTTVIDFSKMPPAKLRFVEAEFLYQQLISAGQVHPNNTLFLMTVYFDAFLFCYVSIEEMVSHEARKKLNEESVFKFLKALRNISTHHSILTGIHETKFISPISRVVSIGALDAAKFFIDPNKVKDIFDEIIRKRPQDKNTINSARQFIEQIIQSKASQQDSLIYLADILKQGLDVARPVVN